MATVLDPSPAGPTSPETLAKFEQYIGHPLPADYRAFLLESNGGHPDPDAFRLDTGFGEEENIVMCLFPMRDLTLGTVEANSIKALRSWPLHCAWDDLQHDLATLYAPDEDNAAGPDEALLPVGTDGSSNYFCLVLDGHRAGALVFLDHETAETFPLAPSFDSFLESLRPRERTDYAF